jgi:hypothetical protein
MTLSRFHFWAIVTHGDTPATHRDTPVPHTLYKWNEILKSVHEYNAFNNAREMQYE